MRGIEVLNTNYRFEAQADGSLIAQTKIGEDAIRKITETTDGYTYTVLLPALRLVCGDRFDVQMKSLIEGNSTGSGSNRGFDAVTFIIPKGELQEHLKTNGLQVEKAKEAAKPQGLKAGAAVTELGGKLKLESPATGTVQR